MAVNIEVKQEFVLTLPAVNSKVILTRDEAHQLWVQLNKQFGSYVNKPAINSIFDQMQQEKQYPNQVQNLRNVPFY